MKIIAFDEETKLIRPGLQTPPPVCLSYVEIEGDTVIGGGLVDRHELRPLFRSWLADSDVLLVGAETAFDMLCPAEDTEDLKLIFEAYAADRVTDVFTRQKLLDLSAGVLNGFSNAKGKWVSYRYDLASLARRHLGLQLEKGEDTWRLRYSELWDVPLEEWPEAATNYAYEDAVSTGRIYLSQEQIPKATLGIFPGLNPLAGEFEQARAGLFLKLMSAYGLRTDLQAVEKFAEQTRIDYARLRDELVTSGLIRLEFDRSLAKIQERIQKLGLVDHFSVATEDGPPRLALTRTNLESCPDKLLQNFVDWRRVIGLTDKKSVWLLSEWERTGMVERRYVRDTKAAARRMLQACEALGREPVKTDKGGIALGADVCSEVEDPVLQTYGQFGSLAKTLSTDVPILRSGSRLPIHSRFEVLQKTGRTGSSGPNVQNVRRLEGIRECFVPRPGYVIIDSDYGKLELHTLAQICLWLFGESALADALNAGRDPHTAGAAVIAGITYEEANRRIHSGDKYLKNLRNSFKVANFGFPGGLGPKTFVSFAWSSYGVRIDLELATSLKVDWLRTWPEMRKYFDYVASLATYPGSSEHAVVMPWSGRLSSGLPYCSACNALFQGLGADVAKHAGFQIARECYTVEDSPLFGARPINFIHDQFLIEVLEERAAAAATRTGEIMNASGALILPDVPVKCEPILARRWSKNAVEVRGKSGELLPWEEISH